MEYTGTDCSRFEDTDATILCNFLLRKASLHPRLVKASTAKVRELRLILRSKFRLLWVLKVRKFGQMFSYFSTERMLLIYRFIWRSANTKSTRSERQITFYYNAHQISWFQLLTCTLPINRTWLRQICLKFPMSIYNTQNLFSYLLYIKALWFFLASLPITEIGIKIEENLTTG